MAFKSFWSRDGRTAFAPIALIFALSCAGCSTHQLKLESTPKSETDFSQPPEILLQRYEDIAGLHPLNALDYLERKKNETGTSRALYPTKDDATNILGLPTNIAATESSKYRLITHPIFGYGLISIQQPPLSAIFFGWSALSLFKEPQEQLTWYKGDYRIKAETFPGTDQIQSWEWDYRPQNANDAWLPVIRHQQRNTYSMWNYSVTTPSSNDYKIGERNYLQIAWGWEFRAAPHADHIYLELQNSLQSFEKKGFNIIDISQQMIAVLATHNIGDGGRELGIGFWYDASVADMAKSSYAGKAGVFAELDFLKTRTTQHAIRLGLAHDVDRLSSGASFIRLQLVTRFLKWEPFP